MGQRTDLLIAQIPRLRRYARALVGDAARADDLVQDCLTRALPKLGSWKPGSDMRAWLFTIMHNQFVNDCRKHKTGRGLADCPVQVQADDAHSQVQMRDLQTGLQALPAAQREVLLLIGVEGLSYRQAAQVLDIPAGTVMSRLHRGREQLRNWMDGQSSASGLRSVK